MPAKVANPRKQFQFNIIIPGLNPFLAQKVKLPDDESDIAEHGDTNFIVKTAGIRKIGSFSVDKIMPSETTDNYMWNWRRQITNTTTGGGDLPSNYKKTIWIEQYAPDGITVIQRWQATGVWPQKINGIDFDRKSSDNTVETIEFCTDEFDSI